MVKIGNDWMKNECEDRLHFGLVPSW
jgi:hypothetical protein